MTEAAVHHPEFTTGAARYTADFVPRDALAAAIVRSPVAHGRLRAIDAAAARAQQGVVAVLAAGDLPELPRIPIRSFSTPGLEALRQPVIARDELRYRGEPVAVVVAIDRGRAEAAARLVELDIAPLEAVVDPELAPEMCRAVAREGEVERLFAQAVTVVERRMSTDRHTGLPLETRGVVARWAEDRVELWGPTKFVDHTAATVSSWFGIEPSAVRLHPVAVGGMFGVRGELYPEDFLVPWAARLLDRPVAWIEDRVEHLLAVNHAPALRAEVAIALDGEGRPLALRGRIRLDMGAYPRGNGRRLAMLAVEELVGPYAWEALDIEAVGVRTHATPTGSVRAPVAGEAGFFRESSLDAAARAAGVSARELRRGGLIPPAEMPFTRRLGADLHPQLYDGGDHPALLERLRPAAERYEREAAALRAAGRVAGSGVALFLAHSGVAADETITVEAARGVVTVHTSLSEVGQGIDAVLRTVAAEALRIPPEQVVVRSGRPAPHGPGRGTFSSRSAVVAANACRNAAGRLVDALARAIAEREGCRPEEVGLVDGGFRSPTGLTPWSALGVQQSAEGRFADSEPLLGIGGHAVLVTIDPGTGRVELEAMTVAYDCGSAIDPEGVRGQLLGGTVHGIGMALTESLGDAAGSAASRTMLQYRLPTARDVPEIDVIIVEGGTSRNPLGVKGAGEAGVLGAPAAIANAVGDALRGALGEAAGDCVPTALPIREAWVRERASRRAESR